MKRSLLGYKVTVVSTMNTPRARTLILSAFDSENFRRISTRGFLYRLTRLKKKIKQCIGHCRTLLAKEKFDILFIVDHMGKEDFSSFALLLLRERERETTYLKLAIIMGRVLSIHVYTYILGAGECIHL